MRRAFLIGCTAMLAGSAAAGEPDPVQSAFFEKEVRPLLAENCFTCHGEAKQKGGLRLDSLEAILQGGDSGPALVRGKPGESLLIEAVHHDGLAMPPKGKLEDPKVRALERWVEIGAPWPNSGHATTGGPAVRRSGLTDEDRAYWFFQPLAESEPAPLPIDDWSRNPIDPFILRKLLSEGLTPAPEADRGTLIRRLTFDLTGLPPTPEELDAFLHDPSPTAYETLVDRLLASPAHGERQARHWLDLVRYAESDGYRQDAYRPDAWRYRDYVVRSLNDDKPYDRFLREQIAGDELDPDDPAMRVAAGYFRLGTYEFNQRDVPAQWRTIIDELTDVTAEAILGLGMGCARCHDHKFDPILQEDYYRLRAFFTPIAHRTLPLDRPEPAADRMVASAAWELATEPIRDRIEALERPAREPAARDAIAKFQPEIRAILDKPPAARTPEEQQLAALAYRQVIEEGWGKIGDKLKGDAKAEWERLQKELASYDHLKPPHPGTAQTVTDVGPDAPPNPIPGDRSGRDIEPGLLAVLNPGLASMPTITPTATTTGRRTALAGWMTRPDNPLTTRVIVNRLWQHHFGRGIVGTSSDFGRLGEPPTHPDLLDWLARRLVADGWSLKALNRLIVTSATYRQAGTASPSEAALRIDPENRLLWRFPPRRLEAEPIRDAMLALSGELRRSPGGPPADPGQPRRSIDTKITRNTRDELLDAFDTPDASLSTARRESTITPTQALLLINGPWPLARANAFAARLRAAHPDAPPAQIDLAFRLALSRPPSPDEQADALILLAHPDGLVDFCHALFNANEFLTVD